LIGKTSHRTELGSTQCSNFRKG